MYAMLNKTMGSKHQAGLSIVELMVSLVISMAVMAGAMQVVVSSKKSFIDQDEVSFIQTNSRFALDLLGKDIRMAGYLGCATQDTMETANSIDGDYGGYVSLHGLLGYEGDAGTDSFPANIKDEVVAGTDAIIVRYADGAGELPISSHNPNAATIHLFNDHEYEKGSVLMIADASCRHVGIFQVSGPNGLPANHIVHNTGAGTNNCTKVIKGNFVCVPGCGPVSCDGNTTASGGYGPGSKIMKLSSKAYYIAESDVVPGMNSLKRSVLDTNGIPSNYEEEVAIGVDDFEILYGIDMDGDGSVDQFRKANELDLNGDGFTTDEEWDEVLTVKLSLVFRSQNQIMDVATTKEISGQEYNDKFLRQAINTTVRIRNRG